MAQWSGPHNAQRLGDGTLWPSESQTHDVLHYWDQLLNHPPCILSGEGSIVKNRDQDP